MRHGENWGLLITTIVQLPIRPHWQPRHHIHAPFLVRCSRVGFTNEAKRVSFYFILFYFIF